MEHQADIREWRARAAELRRLADTAATPSIKDHVLEVARGYEILADEVAARREEEDALAQR
jgi:hypothetical protein